MQSPARRPRGRSAALGVLLTLCLTILLVPVTHAQSPDSIRRHALRDFHGADLEGKDGPLAKAGMDLLLLYHRFRAEETSGIQGGDNSGSEMQIRDGRVTIDAIATATPEALKTDLEALGLTEAAVAGRIVSGRFPIAKIPDLARLSTLRGVQPSRAQTRDGAQATPSEQELLPRRSLQEHRSESDSTSSPRDTAAADAPTTASSAPDTTTQRDTSEAAAQPASESNWGFMVVGGLLVLGGLLFYLWSS